MSKDLICICGHARSVHSYEAATSCCNILDKYFNYIDFCMQFKPDPLAIIEKAYEKRTDKVN